MRWNIAILAVSWVLMEQPVCAGTVAPMVAAGGEHTVALSSGGKVFAFGSDSSGQLGLGRAVQSSTAVQAQGFAGGKAIAAGAAFTSAVIFVSV